MVQPRRRQLPPRYGSTRVMASLMADNVGAGFRRARQKKCLVVDQVDKMTGCEGSKLQLHLCYIRRPSNGMPRAIKSALPVSLVAQTP